MHELGILHQVMKSVEKTARENNIKKVTHITLEVGTESGCVLHFLNKLFPVAVDNFPSLGKPELKIETVPGKVLQIKDFGYEK